MFDMFQNTISKYISVLLYYLIKQDYLCMCALYTEQENVYLMHLERFIEPKCTTRIQNEIANYKILKAHWESFRNFCKLIFFPFSSKR